MKPLAAVLLGSVALVIPVAALATMSDFERLSKRVDKSMEYRTACVCQDGSGRTGYLRKEVLDHDVLRWLGVVCLVPGFDPVTGDEATAEGPCAPFAVLPK